MDAANCAAVLLSVPISYHFHGCTALLVALVVVSGAILNTHLYLYLYPGWGGTHAIGVQISLWVSFTKFLPAKFVLDPFIFAGDMVEKYSQSTPNWLQLSIIY